MPRLGQMSQRLCTGVTNISPDAQQTREERACSRDLRAQLLASLLTFPVCTSSPDPPSLCELPWK